MDISFSKAELEKLVEIAIMAEWVMTAHDYEEEDGRRDDYIKLIQKIYAHASKNGMKKEIDFMDDIKEYMPNADWEDQTQAAEFIREYEEKTFWDELIERLADRDMNRKLGGKKAGSFEEHMAIYEEFATKYGEEFAENELENLEVKQAGKAKPAAAAKPGKKR